jgi:hypothetical protein
VIRSVIEGDTGNGGTSTQTAAEASRVNLPTVFPVQPQPEAADSELVALGKCVDALNGLDLDQANRIVSNLAHRFVNVPMTKRIEEIEERKLRREELHEERMQHVRLVAKAEGKN